MSSDEEFARKLQQQYDEESLELNRQEEMDYEFASSLVGRHDMSDSDTEGESESVIEVDKKLKATCSTDKEARDSEETPDEEELMAHERLPSDRHINETSLVTVAAKDRLERKHEKKIPPPSSGTKLHSLSDSEEESEECEKNARRGEAESKVPPLCKFGAGCYRKNSAHRKQFRHPDPGTSADEDVPSKRSKSSSMCADDMPEYLFSQQFGLYLTKVKGIPNAFNKNGTIGIQEILSPKMGSVVASAQFNYITDIEWLVEQYPPEFRTKPLLIVHGEQRESKKALEREAGVFPHITLSRAKLEIMFGTHHTKMMLLMYEDGLRIVIHTANLIRADWHQKTQGVWLSPKFPSLTVAASADVGDSPTKFKRDILKYLKSYNTEEINEWCNIIERHDCSQANIFLVASTPGRHAGENKFSFGHLKLRKILREFGPASSLVNSNWPVICQFSSIGSLGASSDAWLCKEFLASLSAIKNIVPDGNFPKLNLIFPSVENVRLSLEGYPAGASLPYAADVAKKQPWLNGFLHQWKSDLRGRSEASPHIKTYCRSTSDSKSLAWFLITSANLSKAAWGALEKSNSQLMIRSYELGVLFLPHFFKLESPFNLMQSSSNPFPIPFDVPLVPYQPSDQPWVWNAPHTELPDRHGNVWSPH